MIALLICTYGRAKDGMVEIHKDQGLAENPMDRIDEKLTAKVFLQHSFNIIYMS